MKVRIGLQGMRKRGAFSKFVEALKSAGMAVSAAREDGHGEGVVVFDYHVKNSDSEGTAQAVAAFSIDEASAVGAGVYKVIVEGDTKTWWATGYCPYVVEVPKAS